MKKKCLAFTKSYEYWTEGHLINVMFSDEHEFVVYQHYVFQKRERWWKIYLTNYETPSHPDEFRTAGLYFLATGVTMNGQKNLELLQDKLVIHMHGCSTFMTIENLWDYMKNKVDKQPANAKTLVDTIQDIWSTKISVKYLSVSYLVWHVILKWLSKW